ncbi:hypothetical protein [Bradyrhizobium brasilense]|uniref:hypothetical protein n=1 Tax=Bradyrhizobium brasilense TaxID=1419277 RepID=UPI001177F671|nr:hypothetical protein [Bradyrhizobium brasilense]
MQDSTEKLGRFILGNRDGSKRMLKLADMARILASGKKGKLPRLGHANELAAADQPEALYAVLLVGFGTGARIWSIGSESTSGC